MVRPSPRLAAGRSLSARRAWIEISVVIIHILPFLVALRKESVDRNMMVVKVSMEVAEVALRKESVDRNSHLHDVALEIIGRSPQGERG